MNKQTNKQSTVKAILSTVLLLLLVNYSSLAQIKVDANGKVGINNSSPTKELDVTGDINVTGNSTLNILNVNDKLILETNNIFHNRVSGTLGGAYGYVFNDKEEGGLLIENYSIESAGLYLDQDYAVIYSPGDGGTNPDTTYGYLLKVIDEDGMVLKWYIDGSGVAYTNSDKNRKENIKEVNESKDKLKQLKAVKFNFKKEENTNPQNKDVGVKFDPSQKEYYGFIAQDVEKIFPELVDTDENGDKYVSYMQLIPILLSAINEQSVLIQENSDEIVSLNQKLTNLEMQIDELSTEVASYKKKSTEKSATLNNTQTNAIAQAATLNQNIPNPFSETTRIDLYLPTSVTNAMLYIYNIQGTQIDAFMVNGRENTSVTIEGHSLKAGMYFYTLIADGKEVDTKKMILTK